jgi:hypothetical protein
MAVEESEAKTPSDITRLRPRSDGRLALYCVFGVSRCFMNERRLFNDI